MLLAVLTATAAFAAPAHTDAPRLTVMSTAPFVVRGTRFAAGESVKVVVTVKTRHVRTKLAGPAGGFVARFGTITLGRCGSYFVRATGSRGSTAFVKFVGECPELGPL